MRFPNTLRGGSLGNFTVSLAGGGYREGVGLFSLKSIEKFPYEISLFIFCLFFGFVKESRREESEDFCFISFGCDFWFKSMKKFYERSIF